MRRGEEWRQQHGKNYPPLLFCTLLPNEMNSWPPPIIFLKFDEVDIKRENNLL